MRTPDTTDYSEWLLDGRRGRKQLNKISSKVQSSYRANRITESQYEKLRNVLDKAFKNIS